MTTPTAWGRAASATALDADLTRQVRRTAYMRQGFYVVVLLVALAGQVSGAVERLHIPLFAAIPAVAALELGGIVVLANADVRRRLGEPATASRILSALIALGAVAFNWLAHADHLLGGFFAGMSALGYLVWLMHTENQRRDRLRAMGALAWTTPAYEIVGHWLAHPWLTRRARALAKADPLLGLYESLAEARAAVRRERRERAIAKVLHEKIRKAVPGPTADIAVHTYDLNEVAARLARGADYDGLTALIAADLAPDRIAGTETIKATASAVPPEPGEALTIAQLGTPVEPADPGAYPAVLPQVMRPPMGALPLSNAPISAPPGGARKPTATVAERVAAVADLAGGADRLPPAKQVALIVGHDSVSTVAKEVRKALRRATESTPEDVSTDRELEDVPA